MSIGKSWWIMVNLFSWDISRYGIYKWHSFHRYDILEGTGNQFRPLGWSVDEPPLAPLSPKRATACTGKNLRDRRSENANVPIPKDYYQTSMFWNCYQTWGLIIIHIITMFHHFCCPSFGQTQLFEVGRTISRAPWWMGCEFIMRSSYGFVSSKMFQDQCQSPKAFEFREKLNGTLPQYSVRQDHVSAGWPSSSDACLTLSIREHPRPSSPRGSAQRSHNYNSNWKMYTWILDPW